LKNYLKSLNFDVLNSRTEFNFSKKNRPEKPDGIAIVAVLGILVVLAIMATAFVAYTSTEFSVSRVHAHKVQSDLLAESALQHALGAIREDAVNTPAWDDISEPWFTSFQSFNSKKDKIDIDEISASDISDDSKWIYVKDSVGKLIGRYAVLIEDEAGKINLNVAASLSPQHQHQGVSPRELLLRSDDGAGLPISLSFGKNILRYRYGRDLRPGQAKIDDNNTASSYATDLIDNDADGIIDEQNEGVDEREEYDPKNLHWDDRAFSSVREAGTIASKGKPLSKRGYNLLKKFSTVHSENKDTYWDSPSKEWRKQVNLNVASRRQISKLLRKANKESRFESDGKNIQNLVGNLIDYRDENHVLSTMGSQYGVEAVCFNEVMANDGSFTLSAGWTWPDYPSFDEEDERTFVHRFGKWYHWNRLSGSVQTSQDPRYGWSIKNIGTPMSGGSVITNGHSVKMPHSVMVELEDEPYKFGSNQAEELFKDFKKILSALGGWPRDIWKNAWLMIFFEENSEFDNEYKIYPILGNTKDKLRVGYKTEDELAFLQSAALTPERTAIINNLWRENRGGMACVFPYMSEYFVFPVDVHEKFTMPKNLYYTVYLSENNLGGYMMETSEKDLNETYVIHDWEDKLNENETPWKGFNKYLDVDGETTESKTEMLELTKEDLEGTSMILPGNGNREWLLRTPYKNGDPVRAKNGFIHVSISTTGETGYQENWKGDASNHLKAYKNKNVVRGAQMIRPDIVELINISDHPISLRNWRVVINTGSYADRVGLIDGAMEYSRIRHGKYNNPNPTILPGEYFYLTSNRPIFDMDYGAPKNGKWGTSSGEAYPCFDLPDALWGVRYRVTSIDNESEGGAKLKCEGADWRKDQMEYELSEWFLKKPRQDQNSSMGVRITITGNGRNYVQYEGTSAQSIKVNDDLMILGMPRAGGFLSMTLKNEYDQITARTITYGSTKLKEVGYSTEKLDPTHYTWRKSPRPTFGGTKRKARNRSVRGRSKVKPYVKDNRFVSVGEIQKVRKAEDWQNIGMEKAGRSSTRTLKSLAKYFTVSGIRLDAEDTDAHVSGWLPAFSEVKSSSSKKVGAKDVNWESGIWKDHTLRITSGKQKGESFAIKDSTESSINIVGYSVPGGQQIKVNPGDTFSVGPGYSTPLYYTRHNSEEGIWEWKNKGLKKANYGLYLFGMNDSIKTTEFFEENHNAVLEVAVYNYKTRQFDRLPLPKKDEALLDDPYNIAPRSDRLQYDKADSIYCGIIKPEHISVNGALKLKLIPHNLEDQDCSGFAWFDYVYLTPGTTSGKININTASERVLRALNDITPEIAENIRLGKTPESKSSSIRPYKNITDILEIDGITPEIFGKIANQITARSDQFRISVIAQALNDSNQDGKFNSDAGDEVIAETRIEEIVDRTGLTDDNSETDLFKISVSN